MLETHDIWANEGMPEFKPVCDRCLCDIDYEYFHLWCGDFCPDCIEGFRYTAETEMMCDDCEADIAVDDDYYDINGTIICERCIDNYVEVD